MRTYEAKTLTKLHDQMCRSLLEATEDELDVITSVDVQIHDVVARCRSMEWEFDLKDMWLTPSRWSMMVKQYLDPERVKAWLEMCDKVGVKGRGIAVLRTNEVKPRGGPAQGNKETRRWGSCMLSLSYKAQPTPQITLHSRTSYLGYIGALDLTVAWYLARLVAGQLNMDVEQIAFCWHVEAIQWHNFKSLAYCLNHPKDKRREYYRQILLTNGVEDTGLLTPALRLSHVWMQKLLKEDRDKVTYGDMNYNTYRRIRRRFHTEVLGYESAQKFEGWSRHKAGPRKGKKKEFFRAYKELPHCHVDSLTLVAIGL